MTTLRTYKQIAEALRSGALLPGCTAADNRNIEALLMCLLGGCETPKHAAITGTATWQFPSDQVVKSFTLIVVTGSVSVDLNAFQSPPAPDAIVYPVGTFSWGEGNSNTINVDKVEFTGQSAGTEAIVIYEVEAQ